MNKFLSIQQAAKLLGISIDEVRTLEKQGILHSKIQGDKTFTYFAEEIERIKSNSGLTISEEAAQVDIQIEREVVSSVSRLQKFFKRTSIVSLLVLSGFILSVIAIAFLFRTYPEQTSDFFGFYYRFNHKNNLQAKSGSFEKSNVLAAETGPEQAVVKTSVLADVLKPIASTSLVVVKAVDSEQYQQIVTNPVLAANLPGPAGSKGVPGVNGVSGLDGQPGTIGQSGPAGASGTNGTNGTNGSNGSNGTSVADVLTTIGDIIIKNGSNTTTRLAAGANGQVLTISGGIPVWADSSGLSLDGDVIGTSGATIVSKINGAVLGTTTSTSGNLLIGNGLSWETQSLSGDATLSSAGVLMLKNIGTAGIYGSAAVIPVLTIDDQGRVNGVTDTTISGLTITNFGSANISQWVNNSGYLTASSIDLLSNKTISAGNNTISGLTNLNLSGLAGITNANLANSNITVNGNSGSASVSLGGGLTFTGSGITNITAAGSTLTVTTTESDTLESVTRRGNKTESDIITTGAGAITSAGLLTASKGFTLTAGTLTLGTTSGSPANTINQATIAVGDIASTEQNNFATLNITNGGSGFLDIELLHGMINWQGMNTFYDDFTGRALDTTTKWQPITTSGNGNTCSSTFITGANGLNGVLQFLTSGTSGRGCDLSTQSTLSNGFYQRGNNPVFETKVSLGNVANVRVYAGFTNTKVAFGGNTNANTHHAYIGMRSTDTQWQCITDNGGATDTFTSTGVTAVANTSYRLRVEVRNGTIPETICTVDDGARVIRVTSTATQPGVTNPMDIYIKAENGGGGAVTAKWDYVRTWQDDPTGAALTIDTNSLPETIADASIYMPDATSSAITSEEKIASGSGDLASLIVDNMNSIFKNLIEFFGQVIFHGDVTFSGRPTFNRDTAGCAFIKLGESETTVNFKKEYTSNPVVTVSVNLTGEIKQEEIPGNAVYDISTKGFKIKLSKPAQMDLSFSWIALSVNDSHNSINSVSAQSSLPIPSVTLIPNEQVMPVITVKLESTQSAGISP